MSYTNTTPNLKLPQYIASDEPTYLDDFNRAMLTIDTGIHALQEILNEGTSDIGGISAQLTTLQASIDAAQKELDGVSEKSSDLGDQINDAMSHYNDLLQQVEQALTNSNDAETTAQAANASVEAAHSTASSNATEIEALEARVSALEGNPTRNGIYYIGHTPQVLNHVVQTESSKLTTSLTIPDYISDTLLAMVAANPRKYIVGAMGTEAGKTVAYVNWRGQAQNNYNGYSAENQAPSFEITGRILTITWEPCLVKETHYVSSTSSPVQTWASCLSAYDWFICTRSIDDMKDTPNPPEPVPENNLILLASLTGGSNLGLRSAENNSGAYRDITIPKSLGIPDQDLIDRNHILFQLKQWDIAPVTYTDNQGRTPTNYSFYFEYPALSLAKDESGNQILHIECVTNVYANFSDGYKVGSLCFPAMNVYYSKTPIANN